MGIFLQREGEEGGVKLGHFGREGWVDPEHTNGITQNVQ